MRCSVRKLGTLAGLLAGGGYLLSGPGTGCSSYIGQTALVATDMCFIFDCQNGILGGVFDPCSGIGSGNQTVEGGTQLPFFTDCPTN